VEQKPIMHCQSELEADLNYEGFLPDEILLKWSRDDYSTSKHLLTLYSIATGLQAKNIVEIGFGRSSFVLAKAANANLGRLVSCDMRDFSYLLNEKEISVVTFIHGKSTKVWPILEAKGIDFAFLDYFSGTNLSSQFVKGEIRTCLKYLRTNGIIAIHDTIVKEYRISSQIDSFKPSIFDHGAEVLSLPFNYGLGLIRKTGRSMYGKIEDQFIKKGDPNLK